MRHLLLEGASGIGKSTAILKELSQIMYKSGGFGTKRVFDEKSSFRGFAQYRAKDMDSLKCGYIPNYIGNIITIDDLGRYNRNISVFKDFTLKTLYEDKNAEFLLLDEIAGFEISDREVFDSFIKVFHEKLPCIGVLKARKNIAEKQLSDREFMHEYERFRKELKSMEDIMILDVDSNGIEVSKDYIRRWILENIK